jgi:hypothetical protein
MNASVWFEFFGELFNVKTHVIWKGKVTTRREILNREHLFPRVLKDGKVDQKCAMVY